MKRLHWLGALTASALLFSAAASADDHHDRRNWDRNHHSDRWDRGRGHDGRWDRGQHDRRDHRNDWRGHDGRWSRGDHWRGRDRRWDDRHWDNRRYHHSPPSRYWVPPGHRYDNGYRRGYWDSRYYGGPYYRGRDYYPYYRRSSLDATVVLSFPIY
jgi:hypothetical protein